MLWRALTGAVLCMVALTIGVSVALTREAHLNEWLVGWAMALLNAALAIAIYAHAMKQSGKAFLLWAIGISGVRAVCMAAAVLGVFVLVTGQSLPYLIAALTGTVCLMNAEAIYLYRRLA